MYKDYDIDKTFETGTPEHYQEYLEASEPFDEMPLTYEQFLESLAGDEE